MATRNPTTPIDPLAGISVGTTRPARTPAANAPTTIAQGRANLKRKRLTGEAYKQARDFARKTTGYNDTSPIWGKRMNVVLTEIETLIDQAERELGMGSYGIVASALAEALELNRELQKRLATGQLIGAQS